jgi:hypothetical protein
VQYPVKARPHVYSDAGSLNVIRSQTSYCDMPRRQSKFESELQQNPPTLKYGFYIYGCATQKTVALNRPIFKRKSGLWTLVQPYSSTLWGIFSQIISWHCPFKAFLQRKLHSFLSVWLYFPCWQQELSYIFK